MDFEVVLIHYRDPSSIRKLVSSLSTWTVPPARVMVWDNSPEETKEELSIESSIPTSYFASGENEGYGGAVNGILSVPESRYSRILILTQDVELDADCAELLLMALSEPRVAVAAPVLHHSGSPELVFSAGGKLSKAGMTRHHKTQSSVAQQLVDVDWADGACLMMDVTAVKAVGGFDPAFFLYVEEVDLHLRLRLMGRRVVIVPTARARQEPGNYTDYLRYRNHVYLTRKHSGVLKPWPWAVVLLIDLGRVVLKGRRIDFLGAIRGIREGYAMSVTKHVPLP